MTCAELHAAGMENFCMVADWAQISIDDDSAEAAFESGRAAAEAVVCVSPVLIWCQVSVVPSHCAPVNNLFTVIEHKEGSE